MLVKPGERIPVDGTVVEGRASVNQAPITGESVPVEKWEGDRVFAATICERGALRLRTERVGRDTTFGQIIRLVEEAEASKAPVQRFADRFTAYYIPVVVAAALATYLVGGSATAAVATVLVACSCAIAMATPITVLAAVGSAARRGIVVKGGRYLEALARVDTVVVDKTGTVTVGQPEVTEIVPLDGEPEGAVLALAGSMERRSEHPLAGGIVRAAAKRGLASARAAGFSRLPGRGGRGRDRWRGGLVRHRAPDGPRGDRRAGGRAEPPARPGRRRAVGGAPRPRRAPDRRSSRSPTRSGRKSRRRSTTCAPSGSATCCC